MLMHFLPLLPKMPLNVNEGFSLYSMKCTVSLAYAGDHMVPEVGENISSRSVDKLNICQHLVLLLKQVEQLKYIKSFFTRSQAFSLFICYYSIFVFCLAGEAQ